MPQKDNIGVCKLCENRTLLVRSHAIPDSSFKRILRTGSGKAVQLSTDQSPNNHTQDSWWTYQLCAECENILNKQYDQYGLKVLRGAVGKTHKIIAGIAFKGIDTKRLIQFFAAVYWRAARSSHPRYQNVRISKKLDRYLKEALLHRHKIPPRLLCIKLSRLDDKTPHGFTATNLRYFMSEPFASLGCANVKFSFIFEGFLIELQVSGGTTSVRNSRGFVNPVKSSFIAPYISPFDIPEITRLLGIGYEKQKKGHSRVRR